MKNQFDSKHVLKTLSLALGAPGFENPVAKELQFFLKDIGKISKDSMGSVLIEKKGTSPSPRIMLAAHMDEVAFMVKAIHQSGLIKFVCLGSWWPHVLPSHRVTVIGSKGPISGVIAAIPPHHMSLSEREKVMPIKNMFIDIGATNEKEARELGVEVGDAILPQVEWKEMASPEIISTKALDDRVGLAVMVQVVRSLKKHPNTVIAAGTTQEEVGIRGAKTAATLAKPDIAIVIEGPPADDLPGCAEFVQCAMGKGPQIRAYDPTMVANPQLVKFFRNEACALKIPFQIGVREAGGTDASAIHLHSKGVPTVVIGVPVRYTHSSIGLLSMNDFEYTVSLITHALAKLNLMEFKSFFP